MLIGTFPVVIGQALRLRTIASIAAVVRAYIRVLYEDGSQGTLLIAERTLSASRVDETWLSGDVTTRRGVVTAARVEVVSGTQFRGRVYARLDLAGARDGPSLCADYVYLGHEGELGRFVPPGPSGGPGYRTSITIKADSVPVAVTTLALDNANTLRRWHAFEWLYNASADAASRVLQVAFRTPVATALPTGFTAGANQDIYRTPTLTLTASQEGQIYVGTRYAMQNAAGTPAYDSTATAPTPLPLDVTEEMTLADAVFSVTDGHANDNDIIAGDREEWLMPG